MQEQGEARREEQQPEGGQAWYCPECGLPMGGPWGMHHHHHMRPWGGKYMGPWAMRHHHGPGGAAPWMGWPAGMACGIVPALMGFALGYLVASARMSAWYGLATSKSKR